jgi:hypothetical protein
LAPGIRGVLGEDFLSRFDILFDYKQRMLRFGEPAPAGERCRFKSMGQYRGMLTTNRLLVRAEFGLSRWRDGRCGMGFPRTLLAV